MTNSEVTMPHTNRKIEPLPKIRITQGDAQHGEIEIDAIVMIVNKINEIIDHLNSPNEEKCPCGSELNADGSCMRVTNAFKPSEPKGDGLSQIVHFHCPILYSSDEEGLCEAIRSHYASIIREKVKKLTKYYGSYEGGAIYNKALTDLERELTHD